MQDACCVTYNLSTEPAFVVHQLNGFKMLFQEHSSGLHVHNTANPSYIISAVVDAYSLLSTVVQNKSTFMRRQIKGVDLAQALYQKLGRPSQRSFELFLCRNLIQNCPVTVDNAKRAVLIYGPNVATLIDKTTRAAAAEH